MAETTAGLCERPIRRQPLPPGQRPAQATPRVVSHEMQDRTQQRVSTPPAPVASDSSDVYSDGFGRCNPVAFG